MQSAWKPPGYSSVSPYLVAEDAQAVVDFLVAGVGGVELRRFDHPDGSIMHVEVRIDDSVIMIGQPGGGVPGVQCHVHVYVPDVDATYAAALACGGEAVQPPAQKGDPDRRSGVRGPAGNTWWFSTQVGT